MAGRFLQLCPICHNGNIVPDLDNPDTMEQCTHCGAEWNCEQELTFDSRLDLTENEICQKGWSTEKI